MLLFFTVCSVAATGFIVGKVQIKGLDNLQSSTVRSYMPIQEGQNFSYERSNLVLKELYDSGFFYTVSLGRRGNTLVVTVKERPMISEVKITGNDEIETSKIQPVLKKLGITIGDIYDPMKLRLFDSSLEQQYNMLGYAATSVTSEIKPLSHNRVAVYIHVDEGKIVKVNSIHFIDNHAFKSRTLREQFDLTSPGIFTWFNHKDRYSPYKLDKDIEALTTFYLNHGYVRFRVTNKKVVYVRGHKRVDLYITVSEGPVYHVSRVAVTGQTLGYDAQLQKLITFKPGDVFSRQQIINSEQVITNFFADKAYAFNKVSVVPNIDDSNHTMSIAFNVLPGKKVYVRRIHVKGNSTTNQEVFRREMRQMEAAPYSLTNVNESKRHMMLTSFVSNVDVNTTPVLGANNQVDLDFVVKERPAGKASLQGGYSSAFGFLYGASVTQPNFMGTGRYVSLGFTNSQVTQQYSFTYFNPYYKWYHLGRGFSVYYNRNRYNKQFNYTPYLMNTLGATVNYVLPLSDNSSLGFDVGYQNIDLSQLDGTGGLAPSVTDFLELSAAEQQSNNVKRTYNNVKMDASWNYDGRDRGILPTRGVMNSINFTVGLPAFGDSLSYYTLQDNILIYIPITHDFILNILGNLRYGGGYGADYTDPLGGTHSPRLPFIYNFYAGGIGTVPGFQQNSLGPIYANGPNTGSALGGNLLTTAGVHLILPSFISQSVRIALTFDAGNVFQSPVYQRDVQQQVTFSNGGGGPLVINDDQFALNNLRLSAGVLVTWVIPGVAPVDLSLAFPLNARQYDQIEHFQFAMGVSF